MHALPSHPHHHRRSDPARAVPGGRVAAGVHAEPQLGGNPQMRVIDDHHATLNFASYRLASNASGASTRRSPSSTARAVRPEAVGTHGSDIKYSVSVSSRTR